MCCLAGLWEWLAQTEHISTLLYPPPSAILESFYDLAQSGKLWTALRVTGWRLSAGFGIGAVVGYALGLLMGIAPPFRRFIIPFVSAIYPIPKIAIYPLILVILGLGNEARIFAISLSVMFPILLNTMIGVRLISNNYLDVARSFHSGWFQIVRRILLPGSVSSAMAGLRLGFNVALLVTVGIETLNAREGLGAIIWLSWETFRVEQLYASILTIAIFGILTNGIIGSLSRWFAPWENDRLRN